MKRPDGFDLPAEPPPARVRPTARAKKKATPTVEPEAVRPAQPDPPDRADPPAQVDPPANVVPLRDEPTAPATPPDRAEVSRGHAASRAGHEAKAARRHARAATRDRRRYEREEVRRFTLRSRRRRTVVTICLGAVALLVAFVLIGAFSPLMALRHIDVQGADRISEDDIVHALEGQLGRPLTLIDHSGLGTVLGTFPLIRSYSTEASPPDTLVIRIVERSPVAVVKAAGGFELVDQARVVIEKTEARPEGYPMITTANDDADSTGFTAAIAVIDALPGELRPTVDTVAAGTRDDVILTLTGGTRVVWGSAEDSELKALVLAQLMKENAPGTVSEFDVSSPGSAVVR